MLQETIVGNRVVIVVDIFESDFSEEREFSRGIPSMPGSKEKMLMILGDHMTNK